MNQRYYLWLRSEKEMLGCGPHINSEMEIIVVFSGSVTVLYEDRLIPLHKNEALIVLPYRLHGFEPGENAQANVYMFSYASANSFCLRYSPQSDAAEPFLLSRELIAYLKSVTGLYKNSTDEFEVNSILSPLISAFLLNKSLSKPVPVQRSVISLMVDYIWENIDRPITVKQIADAVSLNSSTVSRIFKESTHLSAGEFIHNIRMEKAAILLSDLDLTITEAAFRSGFGSVRSFNRIFSDYFHCTPTEYRKHYGANSPQKPEESPEKFHEFERILYDERT